MINTCNLLRSICGQHFSSHCCDSFCINFLLTLRPLCMSSSSLEIFQRRCCSCRDLEF
jgi:hypothetical protein